MADNGEQAKKPHWRLWITMWIVHFALWLLYVAKFSFWETLMGLAASAIATVAYGIVQAQGNIQFRPTLSNLLEAWRMPKYLFTGSWEILQGLAKQVFTRKGAPSVLAAVAFDAGQDDPESAARRALAVTYTTLTPNFIVLGIIHEQKLLLYHQIMPGEVLTMTRNLGARP